MARPVGGLFLLMHRFSVVFLISGLLFSGYIFFYYWGDSPLMLVPIGLGAGLIFGTILGVVGYGVGRWRANAWLRFIGIFLLVPLIAGGVGEALALVIADLPHGHWRPLAAAPEKPVRFLTNSAFTFWGGSIYVETESGSIWAHSCDSANPCGWQKAEALPPPPEKNFWSCEGRTVSSGLAPPFFENVHDTYTVNVCGVDYVQHLAFILSETGTIWVWSDFQSALESIGDLMVAGVVSGAIGFLSVFILLAYRRKYKWY